MVNSTAVRLLIGFTGALFLASCGGGTSASQLTLSPVAAPPPNGVTGAAYPAFTFVAPTGGVGPFRWTETGKLPPGMSLSAGGTLSGTPTLAGPFPFTATVADESTPNLTATESVTLVIIDSVLVISTASLPPQATVSYPYAGFQITASGGSAPLTWKLSAGQLPPGLSLASDGSISGTPSTMGSFSFTATVTDSAPTRESTSQTFTLVVNNPPPLVINPTPTPPVGTACTPYPGFSFSATGGFLPLAWITTSTLPPGLSLGIDGTLTGIPTIGGSFPVTVTVTDGGATPAMNSLQFTISIATPPPTVNPTPPPTATVGLVYPAFTFTACGGLAPLVWSETGMLPAGLAFSASGVLSGTPAATGVFPIAVSVTDAQNRSAPPVSFTVRVSPASAGTFTPTLGNMSLARYGHTATLLLSGQVLVAGGSNALSPVVPEASAELYDPTSEKFAATGAMNFARYRGTATLLGDATLPKYGMVLMVGEQPQTAELYDPASGTFTTTGTLLVARSGFTATVLNTGEVLIAGGATATSELYDPSRGTFMASGNMTATRVSATATLLANGDVLISGGETASAELYNPTTGTFTATGSMSEVRTGHSATLLTDGTVLIAGPDVTAELYNPATGMFAPVGILPVQTDPYIGTAGVTGSTATLRQDGTILVAGGQYGHYPLLQSLVSAELYAPQSEGFIFAGSLNTARDRHTATQLGDGTVLLTGGINHKFIPASSRGFEVATVLSSAELFK
jgi:hypothetical protein